MKQKGNHFYFEEFSNSDAIKIGIGLSIAVGGALLFGLFSNLMPAVYIFISFLGLLCISLLYIFFSRKTFCITEMHLKIYPSYFPKKIETFVLDEIKKVHIQNEESENDGNIRVMYIILHENHEFTHQESRLNFEDELLFKRKLSEKGIQVN